MSTDDHIDDIFELAKNVDPAGEDEACSSSTVTEAPGTVIDRYTLDEEIGEGGFGVVFKAEQRKPVRREVALKILKAGMDTRQVVARFEAERQALAMMDHPGIAMVLDGGTSPSRRPYFVMELVDGIPITEFCDEHRLNTRQRLELFMEVCAAVQHAHQKGVIHRDLKPSNVLVGAEGERRFVKVIDFGIAKAVGGELTDKTLFTRGLQVMGTPQYLAPEQAALDVRSIDTRADVYSLGVLLYELLTGTLPFSEGDLLQAGVEAMLRVIREKEPQRPSTQLTALDDQRRETVELGREADMKQLGNLIRGDLDWITLKALEKEPDRRYDSSRALADDIARHLAGDPVLAAPPSGTYRMFKFIRKNRMAAVAGAVTVLALLAGLAVSLVQMDRATRAEGAQAEQARKATTASESAAKLLADGSRRSHALARQAFDDNDYATAFAHLADALRYDRGNDLARTDALNRVLYTPGFTELPLLAHQEIGSQPEDTQPRPPLVSSPGGSRILRITDAGIQIRDRTSGQAIGKLMEHEYLEPDGLDDLVSFSPDGRWIVSQTWAGIRLWEADSQKLILRIDANGLNPEGLNGDCTEFSPDGLRLVTYGDNPSAHEPAGSTSGPLRVWDCETGALLGEFGDCEEGELVRFSPDGLLIIVGRGDDTQAWSSVTGRPVGESLSSELVEIAKWNGDGTRIMTGTWNGLVRGFGLDRKNQTIAEMRHDDKITAVGFVPGGDLMFTASWDRTVGIWDAGGGLLHRLPHEGKVTVAACSEDGTLLASDAGTEGEGGIVYLWNIQSGALLWKQPVDSHVSRIFFHPDKKHLILGGLQRALTLRLADGALSREVRAAAPTSIKAPHREVYGVGDVLGASFAEGDEWVVSAGHGIAESDGVAWTWDARTGEQISDLMKSYSIGRDASLSDDRRLVATAGFTCPRIWDTRSGIPLGPDIPCASTEGLEFSPRGGLLCWGSKVQRERELTWGYGHLTLWPWLSPEAGEGEDWSADLEFLAALRLNSKGDLVTISEEDRLAWRGQLFAEPSKDSQWRSLLRWRLTPPWQRKIFPGSDVGAGDYVEDAIDRFAEVPIPDPHLVGSIKDYNRRRQSILQIAYHLNPAHPLIHFALASIELQPEARNLYLRHGLNLLPEDDARICAKAAAILLKQDALKQAIRAADRALAIEPDHHEATEVKTQAERKLEQSEQQSTFSLPDQSENSSRTNPDRYPAAVKVSVSGGEHVCNPYTNEVVDVQGIPSGTLVADPNDPDSNHLFRVP